MTTTDDTALQEQIRDEIAGHPIGSGYYSTAVATDEADEIAAAVLPIIRAEVAKVRAEVLRRYADALERNGSRHAWDAHHFVSDVREWADFIEEEQNDGR